MDKASSDDDKFFARNRASDSEFRKRNADRTFFDDQVDDEVIDLRALWLTLYRRRWAIISLTTVVVMLTTLIALSLTPVYRASATLLVGREEAQVVSIEQMFGADGAYREYLLTQFELLKSRDLAKRVVAQLDLNHHFELDPRQQPEPLINFGAIFSSLTKYLPVTQPEHLVPPPALSEEQKINDAVVAGLMGRIEITPVSKTQLVMVSVAMKDPVMATAAANALASGYISGQLEARVSMTLTATSWMNQRLLELKGELAESELKLQAYREQESLLDLEGITSVSSGELDLISRSLADARQQRAGAESAYRQIQSMKSSGWRSQATVPVVISNELVQIFKADEARASTKVEELSRRYGEKHPKMQAARSDLKTATTNLQAQVAAVVSAIERSYQLARSSERSLMSSVEQSKGDIQSIKRKEFKLRELQREVDANRSLYDTFLTRLKETSATSDIEATNARVVEVAVVPTRPFKPRKKLMVALAGFLAFMFGIGMTLLLDALNNTFKRTEDVENHLHMPVLGILPLMEINTPSVIAKLSVEDNEKSFTESVRSIRTGVVLSGIDNPHKILVVTSSIPQEGKSSVASNLAFSLGKMERVLLVDADMRKPSVAANFGFPVETPGLANIVADAATVDECTHAVGGIDVICAGIIPPNPLELLSSRRFAKLLGVLDQKYDRIVIDSPPVQAVSDALVLSTFANAVIYVIKSDDTPVPIAKKGLGQLLQSNAPVAGVVLNQVDVNKAQKYGYSFSSHYDYYGYSSNTKA
ncbi:MAG: polysaccharide biosynthesis tyrosine autokinase [Porticoccaceae bacterium]